MYDFAHTACLSHSWTAAGSGWLHGWKLLLQTEMELTESTASSLALSVSVTRSVAPLNSISRGLSTFSAITCRTPLHDLMAIGLHASQRHELM